MKTFQSWNPKTKRYVKFDMKGGRPRVVDVKQQNPAQPFKGVPIKKKKP